MEIRFRGRQEVRAMLDGEHNVSPHRLQSFGEAEMSGNKKRFQRQQETCIP